MKPNESAVVFDPSSAAGGVTSPRLQPFLTTDAAVRGGHTVRLAVPAGVLTAGQLNHLAAIAELVTPARTAHLTARQSIELHDVAAEDVPAAVEELAEIAVPSIEPVGAVTCCPLAGLTDHAAFDPTPYARAAAHRLYSRKAGRRRNAPVLPAAFRVTFDSGCCDAEDCGRSSLADVALLTRAKGVGEPEFGFEIRVGGEPPPLVDFVPADKALVWLDAVLLAFARHQDDEPGARGHSYARLRHLIERVGLEAFRDEVRGVRKSLPRRAAVPAREELTARSAPLTAGPLRATGEYLDWRATGVRAQAHPHFYACFARAPFGALTAVQMRAVAAAATDFGDGTVRVSDDRRVVFRWVRAANTPALHTALAAVGLGAA